MLNLNMNANFAGTSTINGEQIATFSASYNGDKRVYFGLSIENFDLYNTHRVDVEADLKAFADKVLESVDELED